jgi:hypothetical protein
MYIQIAHFLCVSIVGFAIYSCNSAENRSASMSPDSSGALPTKQTSGRYRLSVGNVTMEIDPGTAGRITSLQLAGQELLTQPDVHAANYGSSFWSAPQSQWNWPPPPVLDQAPYEVNTHESRLQMKSQSDSLTGYAFTKEFYGNPIDTTIHIQYTIANVSGVDKTVAPWEVTRVPAGGFSFFPKGSVPSLPQSNLPVQDSIGIIWFAYDSASIVANQKIFMNGSEGWLAHIQHDIILIKQFPDVPAGQAAPGEEEVEIYANKERTYVELENQGAYQPLPAGKSETWTFTWYVRRLPKDIAVRVGNQALVDYVRKVLGTQGSPSGVE